MPVIDDTVTEVHYGATTVTEVYYGMLRVWPPLTPLTVDSATFDAMVNAAFVSGGDNFNTGGLTHPDINLTVGQHMRWKATPNALNAWAGWGVDWAGLMIGVTPVGGAQPTHGAAVNQGTPHWWDPATSQDWDPGATPAGTYWLCINGSGSASGGGMLARIVIA